ncbi:hypothetical protein HN587_01775 [Candidatus Woesearchaeota archaeon]|jgi:hypothetical protein|nr:hypothetical protein [Candidatus Woesearchaeota archaeon]
MNEYEELELLLGQGWVQSAISRCGVSKQNFILTAVKNHALNVLESGK